MMLSRQKHFFIISLAIVFILSLAIGTDGYCEEAPLPDGDSSTSIPFHLKSDVITIFEAAFLVFEEYPFTFFMAPHVPIEASYGFSCHSLSEAIGVLESKGKIKIGTVLDETIFLAAPLKEFEIIKTLAEENYNFIQKVKPFSREEGEIEIQKARILPGAALLSSMTISKRMPVSLDQVPEGDLGFHHDIRLSYEKSFSLAAAILGCHMYLKEDTLVVSPVNTSRTLEMMPIAQPVETDELFKVIATIGWNGGRAVIQHSGELLKVTEHQVIGDSWRVLKIRPGEVDMVNELSNRQETFRVP
ncbi:MAG: hypothetical protein HQM09_16325 [Candidatus Riflebacteria bacterium]|nr:hypothetical protein [Candidatus Riflebacteria bacterium]